MDKIENITVSAKQVQKIQLNILSRVTEFCNRNKLGVIKVFNALKFLESE